MAGSVAEVTFADLDALERRLSRPDIERDVRGLKGWRRDLEEDTAFGRITSGQQWIDGVSIVDGTVEGNVFRSVVTISNLFKTGESPADRWELDSAGFRAYGTVSAVPNTKTVDFGADGDFELGVSPNQITFIASTGTLTVPVAVIGSLTIASVGSGILGGSYATAAINPKITLSTSGIVATNTGGTTTFNLEASSGDFFMTGNFTIASSTTAASRLELKQTGIELWKGGTREFYLQGGGATNAISMLLTGGGVGQYIGMQPDTGFWLGASTFAGSPFRVSPAGAVTMTSATITNGTLTSPTITSANITSTTITGQTIRTAASGARVEMDTSGVWVYNSGGTNTAKLAADGSGFAGTGGLFSWNSAGTLTVNGSALSNSSVSDAKIGSMTAAKLTTGTLTSTTITIGTGGKIVDGDGSYWDSSGIVLKSAGAYGDAIRWNVAGSDAGTIYASGSALIMVQGSQFAVGSGLFLGSTNWQLRDTGATGGLESSGGYVRSVRFYPGNGNATFQGTYYIEGGGGIQSNGIGIGGMLGISSGNTINFISPGTGGSAANWSSFTVANVPDKSAGFLIIQIAGTSYRVPHYANG